MSTLEHPDGLKVDAGGRDGNLLVITADGAIWAAVLDTAGPTG